jgi:prepilin-type N-terminal cleavage/methylation domain-containing protein
MARGSRGFTLLETLIALSLVSVSMTGLVVAIGSGSKFGALARRQANAMTVARSQAEVLSHVPYADASIANANTLNDGDDKFADPAGLFAVASLPTGNDAADVKLFSADADAINSGKQYLVGDEKYDVFVNVRPVADPVNGSEMGKQIAVIVRYKVGAQWMRAIAIGYRYNPVMVGVADGLML